MTPPLIVPPGRNSTLRDAWEALYGKPKKAKAEADVNFSDHQRRSKKSTPPSVKKPAKKKAKRK